MLHRHAVDEKPVEGAVPLEQVRPAHACQPAACLLEGLGRQVGIELRECRAEASLEHDVAIAGVRTFRVRLPDGDLEPVGDRPPERRQARERPPRRSTR